MGGGVSLNKKEIILNDIFKSKLLYLNDENKNYEYYIIRKNHDLILYLGKIIKCTKEFELERMCWHDGPIYKFSHYEIIFENASKIDDNLLVEKFKKLDDTNIKFITDNYSNLFFI